VEVLALAVPTQSGKRSQHPPGGICLHPQSPTTRSTLSFDRHLI